MKKSLIFWFAAVTCAALFLVGCESPTNGDAGAAGAPGTIYLSGSQTTAGIQDAIDSGAPLVFAGVAQSDNGTVTIPAGRGVKLVGDTAYSVETGISATLIVSDGASIASASDGKIAKGSGTALTLVAPASVLKSANVAADVVAPVTLYNSLAEATAGGQTTTVALAGPVSVVGAAGTTAGKTVKASDLSGVTTLLYVVGNLTVSADLTTTPLYVTGKASFDTAAQTGLMALTAGSVESSVAITAASGADIIVAGELKTTAAAGAVTSHVTLAGGGKLNAGSLNLAGNLVVGTATTDAVTVKGAATIGGTVTTGAAAELTFGGATTISGAVTPGAAAAVFNFNGPTTIAETFTPGAPSTVIGGTGAVTVTKALSDTTTNTVIIKNTGGVTLTAANTIGSKTVATKVTLKGDGTNGVTIDGDGALVVGTNSSVTVPADGSIVVGDGDNQVTITGAVLKAGTYTGTSGKLSLSTTAEIDVANGGAIEVAGSGDLELTLAATKVILNAGGAVDVKAGTGKFGEATQANTKLTVGTAAAPTTPTKATVVKDGASAVWTVTTLASGTGTSATVIFGDVSFTFTDATVNELAGADPSGAAGKIVAGTGTAITFIGSDA